MILSISLFVINIFMIILNGSLNALPGKIDIFYNLSLTTLCNFKDKNSDEIDLANISGLAAKLTVLIDGDLFDDAIATQKEKISLKNKLYGINSWQAQMDSAFLKEIETVSKLDKNKRKIYIMAINEVQVAINQIEKLNLGTAEFMLRESLPKLINLLGENSTYVAITSERIGLTNYYSGNSIIAYKYLVDSLASYTIIFGKNHPCVHWVLTSIGTNDIVNHDFAKAELWLKKALEYVKKRGMEKSIEHAAILLQISHTLIKKRNYKEAHELNTEAILIVKDAKEPRFPHFRPPTNSWCQGYHFFNSANIKLANKEYVSAESDFKTALKYFESLQLTEYGIKIEVYRDYSALLRTLVRPEEADQMEHQIKQLKIKVRLAMSR